MGPIHRPRLPRGRRQRGASRRAVSRAVEIVGSAGLPLLGVVQADAADPGRRGHDPSAAGRAVGELAVRLRYADEGRRPRVLAVTSPGWREGSSRLAADLAIVLAETGLTVALVEADLHQPVLADLLGVPRGLGLTDVVSGRTPVDKVMRRSGTSGRLWVMTGGTPAPDLPGLFAGPRLAEVLAELTGRALVVVDAPAVLHAPELAEVLSRADDAVLTVAVGVADREEVRRAASRVIALGTLLGAVVTAADEGRAVDDTRAGREPRRARGGFRGKHRAEPVMPSPFLAVSAASLEPASEEAVAPVVAAVAEPEPAAEVTVTLPEPQPQPEPQPEPAAEVTVTLPEPEPEVTVTLPEPKPAPEPTVTLPSPPAVHAAIPARGPAGRSASRDPQGQVDLASLLAPFTRRRAGADPEPPDPDAVTPDAATPDPD